MLEIKLTTEPLPQNGPILLILIVVSASMTTIIALEELGVGMKETDFLRILVSRV
jgi:hypothetical protein